MSYMTGNDKGIVGTPPGATGIFKAHSAWTQLVEPGNINLAWRRAACQDHNACAISELARGGVLQILQRGGLATVQKTAKAGG